MTQSRAVKPVLELKGRMMTLTVLRLLHPSVEVLGRELDRRIEEAPALFRHLPVLIDVSAVAGSDLHLDLPGFTALLRARELVPVGIRGADERWSEAAQVAGLARYPAEREHSARARAGAADEKANADTGAAERAAERSGLMVTEPVRSGQQVYARGGDLVVAATVSPGAELLADGHIHVYGTLSGRALAGVQGDTAARIFCQRFRAELVSIAGTYGVSEQLDQELLGKPVQVSLAGDTLHVEPL